MDAKATAKDVGRDLKKGAANLRDQVGDKAGHVRDELADKADQVAHRAGKAGEQVAERAQEAKGELADRLAPAQDFAKQADQTIRDALSDYPVACMFGALAIGYTLGRIIAKR